MFNKSNYEHLKYLYKRPKSNKYYCGVKDFRKD